MLKFTRRSLLIAVPLLAAGCTTTTSPRTRTVKPLIPDEYVAMYGAVDGEAFPVAATDLTRVEPQFLRRDVAYPTDQPPGTIVVDTEARYLYLVRENGRALRYGIGVGKAGLEFEGEAVVQYKRQWPRWTPTQAMIAREPERYGPLAAGMEPGVMNPLGPRALYLFKDGKDTLYRIHGTTEAWTIGKAVSSGCIRLLNQDIIDLYRRVPNGSRVVVLQGGNANSRQLPQV
ncbi:lipoprotein-anchoring transpeptidase ErfK/SrfK [Rhizobium flavum]|uniref:Lipoprotein-anchoring transpeptidase ErfK/SrfK n=1 Tax=Pseudorhizobium flavum TaxID=1335061 RepID=A0A7X0DDX5_9HYPH|nr:lipoprotein-anchoring transpeptidase ErfK/SrfK [Pseudorhizobium flavum]CAD6618380.1 L,D-transpeptidase [Pseudorhizobium flavum]